MKHLRHPARTVVITPIYLYRLLISPLLAPRCRFHPTCSHYAADAIMGHGIVRGCALAVRRVFRCHPWAEGGSDPVPSYSDPRV